MGDAETSAAGLAISASSSNSTLLPTSNIVLGGSGASRTITMTPTTNFTGTATITLQVSDSALAASTSFPVTVTGSPFLQWKNDQFGADVANPAIVGDGADPDFDGLQNFLEYALGTSPRLPDGPGISATAAGGIFRLNYTHRASATDVTLHAWWTTDLNDPNSWTTSGVTESNLSPPATVVENWQATVPVNSAGKLFFRLKVTTP